MSIATTGRFLIIGLLALNLGGCMMAVRGAGGDSGEQTAKTLVRESEAGDLSLTLDVPPLSAGREARLLLKLSRLSDGTPVTGAAVAFIIESGEQRGGTGKTEEQESEEIAGKGLYQFHYKVKEPGGYRITALARPAGAPAGREQRVSLTQATGKAKTSSLWLILGAAAVLAVKFLIL
jgi:hypothetical protein